MADEAEVEVQSKMRLTGVFYQRAKRANEKSRWVAVFGSPGGSRVRYIDMNPGLKEDERDRAEQMAKDLEEDGVTWK